MWGRKSVATACVGIGFLLASSGALAWEMECTVDAMDDEETCKLVVRAGSHRLQVLDAGGTGLGVSMGVSGDRVTGSEFMIRIDQNEAIDIGDASLIMIPEGEDLIAILPSEEGRNLVEQMKAGLEIRSRVQTSQGREMAEFSLMGFTDTWNEYADRVNKEWE